MSAVRTPRAGAGSGVRGRGDGSSGTPTAASERPTHSPWSGLRHADLSSGIVEYADAGEGPTVVLLHGLLMNHTLWDRVLPLLPDGLRYVRPILPLGGHRIAQRADADLSLDGLVRLVAEFLDVVGPDEVTLVVTDWGGGLFLTARDLDRRVAKLVILPCEAWDNFPPGLPGRMAALTARLPGGLSLAARMLRVPWLRRSPLLLGQMAKHPLPTALIESWTDGLLNDRGVRRDVRRYVGSRLDGARLRADTEALAHFVGKALVVWCNENKVMPPEHGTRLAELLPDALYAEVEDAFVLPMLDNPAATAQILSGFLRDRARPG